MLETYRELFDDDAHLARTLGVSQATLYRWLADQPIGGTATRLLTVLVTVANEAPAVHAVLLARHRRRVAVPVRLSKHRDAVTQVAHRGPVYTLAAFHRGEYDDLFPSMTDEVYEAWRARLL